jgi:hypothetical protein
MDIILRIKTDMANRQLKMLKMVAVDKNCA